MYEKADHTLSRDPTAMGIASQIFTHCFPHGYLATAPNPMSSFGALITLQRKRELTHITALLLTGGLD